MGTTQPIRNREELKKFEEYYETVHPKPRNYALVISGICTALRISDLLRLRWKDVYDFKRNTYRPHLSVLEQKTGKINTVAVNAHVERALEAYRKERCPNPPDYIFSKTTDPSAPLSRSQAFRIIRRAAQETLHAEHISCHSLRKTFGYHAWKQGAPPVLLMNIYNHSSYQITKRYLGIEQDEKDAVFLETDL